MGVGDHFSTVESTGVIVQPVSFSRGKFPLNFFVQVLGENKASTFCASLSSLLWRETTHSAINNVRLITRRWTFQGRLVPSQSRTCLNESIRLSFQRHRVTRHCWGNVCIQRPVAPSMQHPDNDSICDCLAKRLSTSSCRRMHGVYFAPKRIKSAGYGPNHGFIVRSVRGCSKIDVWF